MKYVQRILVMCMPIVMFISMLLTAEVVSAASRAGGSLHTTNTIVNRELSAVEAVSTNDIWSVGISFTPSDIPQTLTEHWNGTRWSIIPSPNGGGSSYENDLYSTAVVSKNDIWAVGRYVPAGAYHTLILHWNGSSWSIVPSPTMGIGNSLFGVAAISTANVWAVGNYFNGSVYQALIVHWDGSSWSVVTSASVGAGNNYLESVAAVSASNIWAVGHYDSGFNTPQHTLIEHWNGSGWSVVSSPNVGTNGSVLFGVASITGSDAWAVGDYYNGSAYLTLAEQWNGSQWSVVTSPNVGTGSSILNAVAGDLANDVWAIGVNGLGKTLIEHWNGVQWKAMPSPSIGTNISFVGVTAISASNAWAVGSYLNSMGHFSTLIEHWNGTKWCLVASPAQVQ